MRTRIIFASVAFTALMPVVALALTVEETQAQIQALLLQVAQLQQQLAKITGGTVSAPTTAPSGGLQCPVFARTLARGVSGEDVTQLQKILKSGGYFTGEPTGYFGAVTEKALRDFQIQERVVASASANGAGTFGPKTRAVMAELCARQLSSITAAQKTSPPCGASSPEPSTSCAGSWQRVLDNGQCHVGWQCVRASLSSGNRSPTIGSIDGPSVLTTNQYGTWTVNASDPEKGTLSYSVLWGDEDIESLLGLFAGLNSAVFSSASRIVHYFNKSGSYSPEVTVRDPAGNTASATFSVTVSTASSTPSGLTPLPGAGTITGTSTLSGNQCEYHGALFPQGTETEGYTINDLCLATGGICTARSSYIPKFTCKNAQWENTQEPPPSSGLPSYGNVVGSRCAATGTTARGGTSQAVVVPGTQLCRDLLCATSQNYATVTLTCEYEVWIDWGIFRTGATGEASVCSEPTPCEFQFGDVGKACAAKQGGKCPTPSSGHPLGT